MRRFLSFMVALVAIICCHTSVSAQQRTEVAKGIYVATYGNVTVIENDNTQQSVKIKVQEKGDSLYDILCGDTVVKTVAKVGISDGIAYVIQAYTTIPKWVTKATVGTIVDRAYEGVCDYFKN